MDGRFLALYRTVTLLKKYELTLPIELNIQVDKAPGRWKILKAKLVVMKQRLARHVKENFSLATQVSII